MVLLAVSAAATACGGAPGGTGSTTGIRGVAEMGPMCPVMVQGSPCPDRPVVGATIQVLDGSNRVVAKGVSDADGHFEISVAPGSYMIVGRYSSGLNRSSRPVAATIPDTGFATVTVVFDSGIR